jgi:integrase
MPTVELTDRFCQKARPAEGTQVDYFDTIVKGLCLRVSPAGTKAWNLVYTKPSDGKRARVKLGTYPYLPLGGEKGARQKARDERAKIGDGRDPIVEKRARQASQTVAELVENYITRHAAAKKSAQHIARRLRRDVSDAIGAVKLTELHRRDITRVLDAIRDRGSPIAANRTFSGMRTMFRWAHARGDLDVDIMSGMKRPTEAEPVRDRVLDANEVRAFWNALPDADMRESTRRILRLCLVTGQRVGEVAGMTLEEVDVEAAVWTIPAARAKNGREHAVPLSDMALAIVRAQMADNEALAARRGRDVSEWLFPGPGARAAISGPAVAKAVKRQEVVAGDGTATIFGLEPFTPHDLRRTMATHMEEIGVSPIIIGHCLNHATVTKATITSRVYATYTYDNEKRDALDKWGERLAGILAGGADVTPFRAAAA